MLTQNLLGLTLARSKPYRSRFRQYFHNKDLYNKLNDLSRKIDILKIDLNIITGDNHQNRCH